MARSVLDKQRRRKTSTKRARGNVRKRTLMKQKQKRASKHMRKTSRSKRNTSKHMRGGANISGEEQAAAATKIQAVQRGKASRAKATAQAAPGVGNMTSCEIELSEIKVELSELQVTHEETEIEVEHLRNENGYLREKIRRLQFVPPISERMERNESLEFKLLPLFINEYTDLLYTLKKCKFLIERLKVF